MIDGADALYDSAKIPHDDRWSLPLPTHSKKLDYLERQLDTKLALHRRLEGERPAEYFFNLALFHEDMHAEACLYTRDTLGYPAPKVGGHAVPLGERGRGDVRIVGGRYTLGTDPGAVFAFDNELDAHEVDVDAFAIARTAVTNQEYLAFVDSGGYDDERLWTPAGWAWRTRQGAAMPARWRRADASPLGVERCVFDAWVPLQPHEPAAHLSWYEADAYCRWAGRRLPTEAEWEIAAAVAARRRYPCGDDPPDAERAALDAWVGDVVDVDAFPAGDTPEGVRQMLGNLWEWTATPFAPYPGFEPGPYKEYSQQWFGTHFALRGGAWSTRARLISNRWRNFYRPERVDIFTGLRTCAAIP